MTTTPAEIVSQFLSKRFGAGIRGQLAADTPLFSTGIVDSFGVLELIAFLEDTFHVSLDPAQHELIEFDTVAKIVRLVEQVRKS